LNYELVKAESEAGAHSKNPDAIDLTMRGWAAMNQWAQQWPTKDGLVAVRAWFDRALEIDPNDANALAGEANAYMAEYAYGWTNPGTDYDAKILGQADRAIERSRQAASQVLERGA
jgi:adenylate cyclase